jgi:hypothetical protein
MPIELKNATLFSIEEFIERCKDGDFIDDDGIGWYGDETLQSRREAIPSEICAGVVENYSFVYWYNK